MRLPRRRSIVSPMPSSTGPLGAKTAIRRPSSRRAAARASPSGPVEHPMVVGESPFPAEARDSQEAGHGALTRGEDGADQQQLGVPPSPLLHEDRREG